MAGRAEAKTSKAKSTKGKTKAAVKRTAPKDEFDEMSLEQLQEEIKNFTGRLTELRRNRNYYMLERDQVQQFYDIVHDEVGKTDAHIRNIEHQMERMQDAHREHIRLYLQKVISLEYEHAKNIQAEDAAAAEVSGAEEQLHLQKKNHLKAQKLQLKQELKTQESGYEEEVRVMREGQRKELSKLREEFEASHSELEARYAARLRGLKDDLELRRKMEIHEIEERKNRHINDLMRGHEKAFAEIKNYYNSITQDNLALIKTLNDDIEQLKLAHLDNQRALTDMERKNQDLSLELAPKQQEVDELRSRLEFYEKDKASLRHAKSRLVVLEDEYKTLMEEHTRIQDKYRKIEGERDHLYATFEETVLAVQQRSSAKNEVLERMLAEYQDVFEAKKVEFSRVLAAANVDQVAVQSITGKLDQLLTEKNTRIDELKYEVARVTKAHDDLVKVYTAKLGKLGIPHSELDDIEPILGHTHPAPADLLTS